MVEARCAIRHLLGLVSVHLLATRSLPVTQCHSTAAILFQLVSTRLKLLDSESKVEESSSAASSSSSRASQLEGELIELEEYHINELKVLRL
mgnify:CR=1 FL=1